MWDILAIPPKGSRLRKALLIQAKYSRRNKIQISAEEKRRMATGAKRYDGFCCIAYNENKKLKWRLVYPYYNE